MAQLASRQLRQLLRMRRAVATVTSIPQSNVTTAHSLSLLKYGCDLESPDVVYGSRSWRLLRPATHVESEIDDWNQHGSRLGVPYLTINADREITEDIWRQTLKHLCNQMPCLKMVMLPYKNEKWICHVDDMEIPLKMYRNVDHLDIVENMLDKPFKNGPSMCKIIKADPSDACPISEEKKSKPYQYYWFMVNHHGLMDGNSQVLMIRYVMNNLNAILAGDHIDDIKPLCDARRGDEVLGKKVKIKQFLQNNPKLFHKEKEKLISTFRSPLLNEAFPAPNVSTSKTARIIRIGDDLTFNDFQKQCKSAGVSVTNGFVAIINTAIVEMVIEAGILRETYQLTHRTNVDLRRYMKIHPQIATGMLIGSMNQSMHTTKNIRKEFWEHAKDIGENAKMLLESDGALVESVVREMAIPRVDVDVIFNSPSAPTMHCDYVINNYKDVTSIMYDPKRHKHALITSVISTQSSHNFNPMIITIGTFRGMLQFTFEYATNILSKETAEDLIERIFLLIKEKSKIML